MHTLLIFIQAALSSQANSDQANHSKPTIVDMTVKKQNRTAVNPPSASDKMMPSFGHQSLINKKTNEQIPGLSENLQGTHTVNSSVPCMSTGMQCALEPEKCSKSETNFEESETKQSIIPQSCFINTKDLNDIYCRFIQEFNLDNMFPLEPQLSMHLTAPILFPKKKKIKTYFKSLSMLFLKSNLAQKQPKVVKICLKKDKTGSEKAKVDEYGITITKNGGDIVTDFNKLVIFEEPTCFGYYDQENSIEENIHPMQTFLQFFVPTTIKPKTIIQNSITVLQITPSEESTNLKTTIGDDNTFVGSTDFNILADGVNIGDKNIFDNFYLGPGVTIGSYNQIKSTIIYADSKIEDNVKIGENVIIGRGVVIKCHAIIGDGVIIEDGVFIDRCAVIKNDVRVKSRSKIGQNVLLENNVSVGNNTVIMNLSKVTNNVLIERDAFIGYDCKICDNILVDENSVVMDKCSFTGQRKLAGVVTGLCGEEKVLDEKFFNLEVMNSWSN